MHMELANNQDYMADNILKVVSIAPCFVSTDEDLDYVLDNVMNYQEWGVYSYAGPHWRENKKILCDHVSEEVC